MLAGAAASEQFVKQSRAMNDAWRTGTLGKYLDELREQLTSEYGRDDNSAGTAAPA